MMSGTKVTKPTTPRPRAFASQIDALSRGTRALWARSPQCSDQERQALYEQLSELDLHIERLAIRASCGRARSNDASELMICAEHLARLERQWAIAGSDSDDGTSRNGELQLQ